MSNETTTSLEQLTAYLENVSEWAIEYETTHEDSAGNYASAMREPIHQAVLNMSHDSSTFFNLLLDRVEMQQSYIMCSPHKNTLGAWAVGEIETQIEISTICTELDLEDSEVRELLKQLDREFCIHLSDNSDCFEMYNNTDNVWEAVVSDEDITECVIEYLSR